MLKIKSIIMQQMKETNEEMTSGTSKVEEAVSKFEEKFAEDEKDLNAGYKK